MEYLGVFAFVSCHGRLLQAYTDGEMHASQGIDRIGEEERWHVYRIGDKYALQNYRTHKYLCGEPDGRAIADRVNLGPWEEWTLYKVGGAKVALKSVHRKWLCAQPPGHNTEWGGEVCADRRDLGPWEKFDMMPVAGLPFPGAPWWQRVLQIAVDAAPIIIGAV